ncbi:MAG: polynucleotide adenylyltransferase PcnB [Gammaproteobacteria bacterium]
MPKRLVGLMRRVFGSSTAAAPKPELRVIPRDAHHVSRKDISPSALKVLYRLKDAGYEAYLVGGGVRDLLLDGHPKDFDVATNATPEQVRRVFNNCRIVGRRFRLAHVLFGRDVVEVATFRAGHEVEDPGDDDHDDAHDGRGPHHHDDREEAEDRGDRRSRRERTRDERNARDARDNPAAVHGKTGMILRDNVWGNVEQDAIRRDFTVNALYYNIVDFSIHDYVGGMRDLEKKKLRLIGDPETRYREDPVRMLRAARFAAKLHFTVDDATAAPIAKLKPLLRQIPPARLFDETLKLLLAGYGRDSWEWLERFGLDEILFPDVAVLARRNANARRFILAALENSDRRIGDGKSVTPAFLFAALLWPEVCRRHHQLLAEGMQDLAAMAQAGQQVLDEQCRLVAIPRRFSAPAREIWDMQLRLPRRGGRRAEAMLASQRFRAAYDFLLLREAAGPLAGEPADAFAEQLGQWWSDYQDADDETRMTMAREVESRRAPGEGGGGGKRRRRRRKH